MRSDWLIGWDRTTLISYWNFVIGGELEELDDGRVVKNVRVAAAGVDIAVIPRGARSRILSDFSVFTTNSVEHCCAPAVALLLYPEFRTGGSDGCHTDATRMPHVCLWMGQRPTLRQNGPHSTATLLPDVHFLEQALVGADFSTWS